MFRHLGAAGLFFLAILDSSPLPTFGGPDILLAILAGSHRNPWYEYAAVTTAGSVIGAYITFRIARKAGASTAIPFPFPTSMVFAAAGASNYSLSRYLPTVAICRAARYSAIAIVADLYGRHFIRVIRHPVQYWPWLLLFAALAAGLIAAGVLINRRIAAAPAG